MKILLDECLPLDFRHSFHRHEAHTAEWVGLKGAKNSELLKAAEAAGYDVLLTVDHGMQHQQRPSGRRLAIVMIHSPTNQLEDLLPLVDEIVQVLDSIEPGQITGIGAPH